MAKKRFLPSMSIRTPVDELVYRHADEIVRAAKNGEKLTSDEVTALQIINRKDVTNRITRIVGLLSIMFVVVLMVGCFLYPFSFFNLFGKGNRFWDCWGQFQIYAPQAKTKWLEMFGGWNPDTQTYANEFTGWITLKQVYSGLGFSGVGGIVDFYALGGWSIILIATIGFVIIVILGAYLLFDSIKDLVIIVQDVRSRTRGFIQDIASTARESGNVGLTAEEIAIKEAQKQAEKERVKTDKVIMEVATPEVKKGRGRPKKVVKEEPFEQPVVETKPKVEVHEVPVKEEPIIDDTSLIKKETVLDASKFEMPANEVPESHIQSETPASGTKIETVSSQDIRNMSDEQLDEILSSDRSLESIFKKK